MCDDTTAWLQNVLAVSAESGREVELITGSHDEPCTSALTAEALDVERGAWLGERLDRRARNLERGGGKVGYVPPPSVPQLDRR